MKNNILINTETRNIKSRDYDFLGIAGENKIEQIVFKLSAFIDGEAILEIEKYNTDNNLEKYFFALDKQDESYVFDVKSSLLDVAKEIKMQLHITTENEEVFKSKIFTMKIYEQIKATETVTEQYKEWIDVANSILARIKKLDETIQENEQKRQQSEVEREIFISNVKQQVENGDFNGATFTPNVDKNGNISWTNNKGLDNPVAQNIRGPQGLPGPRGEAFQIKKTYPTVEAMQADYDNMQTDDYVMIASTVEEVDNAKLYTKTESGWAFICDFSGAIGIQGIQGEQGVGISRLEVIDGILYVTLTNNVTQNAGTIITEEVKNWLIQQITDNAESNFNQFYNEKVEDFNNNVTNKTNEFNESVNTINEELQELADNMPWNTTEQATEITVEDAAKYSRNKLELFGNTEQAQYKGVNIFDYENIAVAKDVTKQNYGAECGFNYTITNAIPASICYDRTFYQIIEPSTTYTFSFDIKYSDDATLKSIYLFKKIYQINQHSIEANKWTHVTFSVTSPENELTSSSQFGLYGFAVGETLDIKNIQIQKGTEETEYEPFTNLQPSPSPDIPQDIHVVAGENIIKIINASIFTTNLFNYKTALQGKVINNQGNTAQGASDFASDFIDVIPGSNLYIGKGSYIRIAEYDKNKSFLKYTSSEVGSPNEYTIKITEDTRYIRFSCGYYSSYAETITVHYITVGEIPTDDTTYKYIKIMPLSLGNIELYKNKNHYDYFYKDNNKWYLHSKIGKRFLIKPTSGTLDESNIYKYFYFHNEPKGLVNETSTLCNYLIKAYNATDMGRYPQYSNSIWWGSDTVFVRIDNFTTAEEYLDFLQTHDIEILGRLTTPVETEITDETLISQLDEIYEHLKLEKGTNYITVTSQDLAPEMKLTYMVQTSEVKMEDIKQEVKDYVDKNVGMIETMLQEV